MKRDCREAVSLSPRPPVGYDRPLIRLGGHASDEVGDFLRMRESITAWLESISTTFAFARAALARCWLGGIM